MYDLVSSSVWIAFFLLQWHFHCRFSVAISPMNWSRSATLTICSANVYVFFFVKELERAISPFRICLSQTKSKKKKKRFVRLHSQHVVSNNNLKWRQKKSYRLLCFACHLSVPPYNFRSLFCQKTQSIFHAVLRSYFTFIGDFDCLKYTTKIMNDHKRRDTSIMCCELIKKYELSFIQTIVYLK